MKNVAWLNFFILGLILFMHPIHIFSQKACTYSIPPATLIIDGSTILPGDTICILGGMRSYMLIKNITGTASSPVVIVNRNGKSIIDTDHFYGIKFSACKHVKLLGTTSTVEPYGIKINRVGNGSGISIDELSTNIELAFIEISNTAVGGIYAKTDPNCTFVATRDKFMMYNIKIHDCYLHDILDEGMYIGSSKFTGQYLADCDTTVLPHYIDGVEVYNNIVENTGWDGIQVSSTPYNCKIYNNIVRFDSYRETINQMSGILIGGGSNCDCYNNQVIDGKGDGIDIFGHGTMKIYNNLIVRAGKSYLPGDMSASKHGMYIGSSPDGSAAVLKLLHNTIISPKSTGINFNNSNAQNNLSFNNIITNPGSFSTSGNNAYFIINQSISVFSVENNLFTEDLAGVKFLDSNNDNYDLHASSPAVNQAFNDGINNIYFDVLNRPRPHNQGYDIGAFESQDPFAAINEKRAKYIQSSTYPNPVTSILTITVSTLIPQSVRLTITNLTGNNLLTRDFEIESNQSTIEINVKTWSSGIYIYQLTSNTENITGNFIVLK